MNNNAFNLLYKYRVQHSNEFSIRIVSWASAFAVVKSIY